MSRRSLSILALVFLAGAVVSLGAFALLGRDHATAAASRTSAGYGYGPGMMGGYGGMMGGAYGGSTQSGVTPADLAAVRDRVEAQLAARGYKGFKVGEIMAFSNNDYVLVKDAAGKPAFELLADPNGRWLIPEPGPNMMWNTAYGMMRGFSGAGGGSGYGPGMMGGYGCPWATGATGTATGSPLTAAQAKTRADAWLADHYPGRVTADATALPGYFTIDVTQSGSRVGMLSVNQTTGAVWYHTWHGTFLADQGF